MKPPLVNGKEWWHFCCQKAVYVLFISWTLFGQGLYTETFLDYGWTRIEFLKFSAGSGSQNRTVCSSLPERWHGPLKRRLMASFQGPINCPTTCVFFITLQFVQFLKHRSLTWMYRKFLFCGVSSEVFGVKLF